MPGPRELFARHERLALAGGAFALWAVGYNGVNVLTWGREVVRLDTPLDRAIPLVPSLIYLYSLAYPCCLVPAFVLSVETLRSTFKAYALAIGTSLAVFVAFPVEIVRPDPPPGCWGHWLMSITRFIDQPFNCFPSLHVSLDFLAAFFCGLERPRLGRALLVLAIAISASTLFVKQHYVLDLAGGILVALVAFRLSRLSRLESTRRFSCRPSCGGSGPAGPSPSRA